MNNPQNRNPRGRPRPGGPPYAGFFHGRGHGPHIGPHAGPHHGGPRGVPFPPPPPFGMPPFGFSYHPFFPHPHGGRHSEGPEPVPTTATMGEPNVMPVMSTDDLVTSVVKTMESERDQTVAELERLQAKHHVLVKMSVEECTKLEEALSASLKTVQDYKERISKQEENKDGTGKENDKLCVLCQVYEKNVVLLPCRHMCLCEKCSTCTELISCPVCRCDIASTMSIYS